MGREEGGTSAAEVGAGGDGGGVGRVGAEGSGWKEGDCDGKFRGEEEG